MFDGLTEAEKEMLRTSFEEECTTCFQRCQDWLLEPTKQATHQSIPLEALHTIKGSAGVIGRHDFASIVHDLETIVAELSVSSSQLTTAFAAVHLASLSPEKESLARRTIDGLKTASSDVEALGDAIPQSIAETPSVPIPMPSISISEQKVANLVHLSGQLVFDQAALKTKNASFRQELTILSQSRESLRDLISGLTSARRQWEREKNAESLAKVEGTLAVQIAKLQSLHQQMARELAGLQTTSTNLQESILETRLVSVERWLGRLLPGFRHAAIQQKKEIAFVIKGGATQIDAFLIAQLSPVVIQLVKNAIAHAEFGEHPQVTIIASRGRDNFYLEVRDNGSGVNMSRLKEKLAESWSAQQIESSSKAALLATLFAEGLTTKDNANVASGRGVGLSDALKRVKSISGRIDVGSDDQGTAFVVTIPRVTSVGQALLFKVGDTVYCIDQSRVQGTIEKTMSPINWQERSVREFDLRTTFSVDASYPAPVIIVRGAKNPYAIYVDKIIGEREIVVKPLPKLMLPMSLFSSGTVSGSGNVQLVIDTEALERMHSRRNRTTLANKRVLVVDDSAVARTAVAMYLSRRGMIADAVESATSALDLMRTRHYGAVITDIEMPEMTGAKLVATMKMDERLKSIPIFVMTSLPISQATTMFSQSDVEAILSKPLVDQDLKSIESRLRKH